MGRPFGAANGPTNTGAAGMAAVFGGAAGIPGMGISMGSMGLPGMPALGGAVVSATVFPL